MKRNAILASGGLVVMAGVGLALAGPGGQRMRGPSGGRQPGPGHRIIALLDADADGEISAAELEEAGAALLALDTDGSGTLTPDEIGRRGPGGPPNADDQAERPPHPLLRQDADGDGVVSLAEFLARPTEHFEQIDADADGAVSLEEFLARPNGHFAEIDANSDGVIDEDEAMAAPPPPHCPGPGPCPMGLGGRGPQW